MKKDSDLVLGDAQQLRLRRRAIRQPAFAVLAHRAHAVSLRGGADVGFRCAVMDLCTDLFGGQQQFIHADPALIAGVAALVTADLVPVPAILPFAVVAQFAHQTLCDHTEQR